MQEVIPYGRQDISQADIDQVIEVLKSDYLTQGPMVPRFEKMVSEKCGADFAVAANSATSALHLACLALTVNAGDIVWTSPITFVASANCALYCGAKIDFVDINPRTYNLDANKLALKLAAAEKTGTLPKVVIPVHLAGKPCDMRAIYSLSQKYGFKIIEDASHAIGGRYVDQPIGNCQFSDITIFSFHPVKIITTGEGGMALTNNSELFARMQLYRSHGITREPSELILKSEGAWYYEQQELGFNYRLTDIQAALGISQLSRLKKLIEMRHEVAAAYYDLLHSLPLVLPQTDPEDYSAFHLFIIRLKLAEISISRLEVFNRLRKKNIMVNVHYIPVYRQPYYQKFNFDKADFPEAESYYSSAITIPMYPGLTADQIEFVAKELSDALQG